MKQLLIILVLTIRLGSLANASSWLPDLFEPLKSLLPEIRAGEYSIPDYIHKTLDNYRRSIEFYINGGDFEETIDQLVTIYCRNSTTNLTEVSPDTISTVTKPSKGFVFIVHGYTDTSKVYYVQEIIEAYHTHIGDTNICVVDYQPISQLELYTIALPRADDVAAYVADFLRSISKMHNVPLSQFTFIGHSFGGYICRLIGSKVNGKLGAIFDIDPCGSICINAYKMATYRLSKLSARYVQAIASNMLVTGPPAELYSGDQVFFPNNGGPYQPGCIDDILCPHYRAMDYFIISFDPQYAFEGRQCDSEIMLLLGFCTKNPCDRFGPHAKRKHKGRFYLFTDSVAPFARNECPSGILKSKKGKKGKP